MNNNSQTWSTTKDVTSGLSFESLIPLINRKKIVSILISRDSNTLFSFDNGGLKWDELVCFFDGFLRGNLKIV